MEGIISPCQAAFVQSKKILDGVMILNEIIDIAKKEKLECLLLKVDFEQAYDCVTLIFLRIMLKKLGFGDKWRSWIDGCIFKSNMSVIVNGSPTRGFR